MKILISGAGIAGPTFAYWASLNPDNQITILERAPKFLSYGQNIDITGSARVVIKKMGLLDEVKGKNTTEMGTRFIGPDGQPFAPFPVRANAADASPTSEYEILRGDLASVLFESTKDKPNVSYLFGVSISSVVENTDESVTVQLSNNEEKTYDLLVAADGQWSKTRKATFLPEDLTVVDKEAYTAFWTIEKEAHDVNWWSIYHALGSRVITVRPDPYNTMRTTFSFMPSTKESKREWEQAARGDRQTKEDMLRKTFADAGWEIPRLLKGLEDAEDFYFAGLQQIKMKRWSTGRVVLLGDAAHAPTPLTGMGTSLALVGAYVLAGEISKLEEGQPLATAFQSYETAYRPFVTKIQYLPSFVPAIAHPGTPLKRWIFQTSIAIVAFLLDMACKVPYIANMLNTDDKEDFPLPNYFGR